MEHSVFVDRTVDLLQPLLGYARVRLRAHEALGDLPPDRVPPEEVVGAALVEALRRVDDAPAGRLYPWLRGFVRQAVAHEVTDARRRRRERSLEEPVGADRSEAEAIGVPLRLIDVLPDPKSPTPEELATAAEVQRAIAALLDQAPDIWREPLRLHAIDGLPIAAVARMEGVTVAETRRRIERAREFLRARLAEEYEEGAAPPAETLLAAMPRAEAAPEEVARLRGRLEAGRAG
ncbi:MAG TPA: hypothetical protein VF406_12850 [Thermodesulfobacteriota bacterium]